MNEIIINDSAISVLVNDITLADDLFERFLEIADNEGFKGDRRIFQAFIDARSKRNEKLLFNYGFSWRTFDRVEAGFTVDNDVNSEVKCGYSIIIGVNLKDELTMDCGLLLQENSNAETLRFLKICGPSYAVHRELFSKKLGEIIEIFSSFLEVRKQKILDAYFSAKDRIISSNIDEILLKSHLAASVRNQVKEDLTKHKSGNISYLDIARCFAKLGAKNLAFQGNRYFEVAGRFIDES